MQELRLSYIMVFLNGVIIAVKGVISAIILFSRLMTAGNERPEVIQWFYNNNVVGGS